LSFSLQNADRPTSNPLPPQSESFADFKNASVLSAEQMIENVAQQVPNFGTEQVSHIWVLSLSLSHDYFIYVLIVLNSYVPCLVRVLIFVIKNCNL
jgi:hypothetical protein